MKNEHIKGNRLLNDTNPATREAATGLRSSIDRKAIQIKINTPGKDFTPEIRLLIIIVNKRIIQSASEANPIGMS